MPITAKKLAQQMGLSEAAVSMALNGKDGVGPETRRRVLEEARRLGYDFARLERKRKQAGFLAFIICQKSGVIVQDMPFFSHLSDGIADGCQESSYRLRVLYVRLQELGWNLADLQRSGCAGAMILATELGEEDCGVLTDVQFPIVLVDNCFDGLPHDAVLMNNAQGSFLAARHLIQTYHTQPGYLRSGLRINNFRSRADGFYRAIRENGLSSSRSIVHVLSPTIPGAYQDMEDILRRGDPLSRCYFADNDLIAAGAAMALMDAGKSVPGDVALVGFDDMPVSTSMKPALTTVRVPIRGIGQLAAHRLVWRIQHPDAPSCRLEAATQLVVRQSG